MTQTKVRLIRNVITTVFGALMMLAALVMFIADVIPGADVDFPWFAMAPTAVLGWVFLMAKDSILEGISLGMFKIKAKE